MAEQLGIDQLAKETTKLAPHGAAEVVAELSNHEAIELLSQINPFIARQILRELAEGRREEIVSSIPPEVDRSWLERKAYLSDSVGSLMELPAAVFRDDMTVRQTIEDLRHLTKKDFITYGYVTNTENVLEGVLVFRDLMLADPDEKISEVMQKELFTLKPEMTLTEAMKRTLNQHYPVYPVCDAEGHLLGLMRGQTLFEARAVEISAQPGNMVGVGAGERLSTPLNRSLKMRHPWLQFNLLTAFIAAAIVGYFEDTLNSVVILAAFLPVLAGQSGNTGCQALAVCLRGLTLGDVKRGKSGRIVIKEALLGLFNGALVGLVAGLGMFLYSSSQSNPDAVMLALVVFISMVVSCIISGVAGATIPLVLKKLGADPATASSIFLTTATDVVSMGSFLGLATWLIL